MEEINSVQMDALRAEVQGASFLPEDWGSICAPSHNSGKRIHALKCTGTECSFGNQEWVAFLVDKASEKVNGHSVAGGEARCPRLANIDGSADWGLCAKSSHSLVFHQQACKESPEQ